MNWRAKPLVNTRVIVGLIGATTPGAGLKVPCELASTTSPKGIPSPMNIDAITIVRADFHGEWNYPIKPINRSERGVDS